MPFTIQQALDLERESNKILECLKYYEGAYNEEWGSTSRDVFEFCDKVRLNNDQALLEEKYSKSTDQIWKTFTLDLLERAKELSTDKVKTLLNIEYQIETNYNQHLQEYKSFDSKLKGYKSKNGNLLQGLSDVQIEDEIERRIEAKEVQYPELKDLAAHKKLVESYLIKEKLKDIQDDYERSFDAFFYLLKTLRPSLYPHVGPKVKPPKIKLTKAGLTYLGEQLMEKGFIQEIPINFFVEALTSESQYRIKWLEKNNRLSQLVYLMSQNKLFLDRTHPPYSKFESIFIDSNEKPMGSLSSNPLNSLSGPLNEIIKNAMSK